MVAQLSFDSQHEDMIVHIQLTKKHDAQMDYYGKRLATASSDRTIRIFEITGNAKQNNQTQKLVQVRNELMGRHEGPVWQASFAHPKFGGWLASCSYDGTVILWKESNGMFVKSREHKHDASVNSISWAPHELGFYLACGSSDGKVSVIGVNEEHQWETLSFVAHQIGVNSVSFAPANLDALSKGEKTLRLATGGCDNLVKLWHFKRDETTGIGSWELEIEFDGHSDWIRDIAFAPNVGLSIETLASCSQDKTVQIYTRDLSNPTAKWTKQTLKKEPFGDTVWRVSWSLTGNVLAVSCGDNKVSLWKENADGTAWECINEFDESQI